MMQFSILYLICLCTSYLLFITIVLYFYESKITFELIGMYLQDIFSLSKQMRHELLFYAKLKNKRYTIHTIKTI